MKLGAIPENPLDLAALATGLAPTPILDTIVALLLARSVMVGVRLGVFEALAAGTCDAAEVARRCGTHPGATERLLDALAGARYLRRAKAGYALAPVARRWLLKGSAHSLYDAILLQFVDARFIEQTEHFVRSGEAVQLHEALTPEEWDLYQRGMRSGANIAAVELARRLPVPRGARDLLDIGGGHGHYSVALCRRHPNLHAVVLDLPEAVVAAAPLLVREEGIGGRVTHRAGDARDVDLGEGAFDVVLICNLIHHFDAATNRDLVVRGARALRPGGVLAIADLIRPDRPGANGQIDGLVDLYFAVTSAAGSYTFGEVTAWQAQAGLRPRRPIRLLAGPGASALCAVKP
jgi:2-polyprenyl-3-methyl-5-hydroxy-6-metoxy-1,4-benzoquinol methylase